MRHPRTSHDAVVAVLSLYILLCDLETIARCAWPGAACGGRGFESEVEEADRAWVPVVPWTACLQPRCRRVSSRHMFDARSIVVEFFWWAFRVVWSGG